MRKIGGRISYLRVQGKYLNWVVLHNQDLNLTGIIGAGQKPKLEQVFISLNVTKGITDNKDDTKDTSEFKIRVSTYDVFQQKLGDYLQKTYQALQNLFSGLVESNKEDGLSIFIPSRIWKIKQLSQQENMQIIFVVTLLSIIPYTILYFLPNDNFVHLLAGFLIAVSVSITLSQFDKISDLLAWYNILLMEIPIVVISIKVVLPFLVHDYLPPFLLSGLVLGFGFSFYQHRNESFKQKTNERSAKEVGTLIKKYDHMAILGKPGSGKSTYLQFIALTFAQEKASNSNLRKSKVVSHRFGINDWYLPILIPLRKVSKFINASNVRSGKNLCIEAFRQEVLPSELREDFSDAFIRHMLRNKRCILLMDGLDEVSNENEFNIIANEINGLVSQYPSNKFIITSRYMGWRGGVGSVFQETEVNDLRSQQISKFAYSWYEAIELNQQNTDTSVTDDEQKYRQQRARDKADQLVNAIRNVTSIRNLAKTPLLLSMICFVHYNKTLPKERISLYEDCSRLLLEQWDIEKGLPQDDIQLSFHRKEIIMQEIAYAMHSGFFQSGTGGKEASQKDIIQIIEKTLDRFDLDTIQAESYFKKLTLRTGLILSTEKYKGLYSFSHLTFQEYYTARYLQRNGINVFTAFTKNDIMEESASSWWREVIILYSGMQTDASKLIQDLCNSEKRDILSNRIQIAAQCLLGTIESPHPDVERELLNELINIRTTGKGIKAQATKSISKYGRDYLLNFATSDDFWEKSIKTHLELATNSKDLAELINFSFR
jgi:energy-coupling factor transporter ATP-binding protein EcfA2